MLTPDFNSVLKLAHARDEDESSKTSRVFKIEIPSVEFSGEDADVELAQTITEEFSNIINNIFSISDESIKYELVSHIKNVATEMLIDKEAEAARITAEEEKTIRDKEVADIVRIMRRLAGVKSN